MTLPTQLWDEYGTEMSLDCYGFDMEKYRVPRNDLISLMIVAAYAHSALTGLVVELADKIKPETMERIQKVHERLTALGCGPEWLERL